MECSKMQRRYDRRGLISEMQDSENEKNFRVVHTHTVL